MEIRLDARRIATSLMVIVVLLLLAHIAGTMARYLLHYDQGFGLIDTFNLNFENNVPTFFAAFMLLASAGLLAVHARMSVGGAGAGHWTGLAILFAFLAVDEDASLHELLIDPLQQVLPMTGPLYFAWVVPYGLALVVVVLLYARFILSLPARTRRLFVAAAGLFVAGALGCELVGGWYLSRHAGEEDFAYQLLVAVEETLEMSGVVAFIYALLDHLRGRMGGQPLRIAIA